MRKFVCTFTSLNLSTLLLLLTLLTTFQLPVNAQLLDGEPEPPQEYVDTSEKASTGYTFRPLTSAQLTSILAGNTVEGHILQLGDTIELRAGTIYQGSFTLRNITSGTGWITIRTSNLADIPAVEARVSPTALFPILLSRSGSILRQPQ